LLTSKDVEAAKSLDGVPDCLEARRFVQHIQIDKFGRRPTEVPIKRTAPWPYFDPQ